MRDDFDSPESDESSGYEVADTKQIHVKALGSLLGLDPSKAERLAEAICALAREEMTDDEEFDEKGSGLLIAMGKKPKE
jgi:hypothetical protein